MDNPNGRENNGYIILLRCFLKELDYAPAATLLDFLDNSILSQGNQDSFNRLGCGHCNYGLKCHFIHPEDSGYLEQYPDTWHFAKEQEAHIQYVHAQKFVNPFYEEHIDRKVREWNAVHPKGPNYYDFHGLTTKLADFYIFDIICFMKSMKIQKSWIETGRGIHSKANFAAISSNFLTYNFPPGVSFVPVPGLSYRSSNEGQKNHNQQNGQCGRNSRIQMESYKTSLMVANAPSSRRNLRASLSLLLTSTA
ncbi:unnamed protein product [Caenorhabditis nigoni]